VYTGGRFEDCRVEAASVVDFLDRYYKPARFRGRGDDYAAGLIRSYQAELDESGFCFISHHDSVTGRIVAYFGINGQGPLDKRPVSDRTAGRWSGTESQHYPS
jgi:hypothetical protein